MFPVWISEISDIGQILPNAPDIFDIVVVDESSQVNLAEIFPVFYRARNICVVGDHKQLSLVSTGTQMRASKEFDKVVWDKQKLPMSYEDASKQCLTVTRASLLDFLREKEDKNG